MNRIIEFRGKDIKTKRWVYGYYYYTPKVNLCPLGVSHKEQKANEQYYILTHTLTEPILCKKHLVYKDSVGQFTGIYTNQEGNMIYEGDIVVCANNKNIKGIVTYSQDNGWYMHRNKTNALFVCLNHLCDYEIIGNEFDDPEIIENL